jgi:hypothetical protein
MISIKVVLHDEDDIDTLESFIDFIGEIRNVRKE